jgi:hypothetical protein
MMPGREQEDLVKPNEDLPYSIAFMMTGCYNLCNGLKVSPVSLAKNSRHGREMRREQKCPK